MNLHYIASLPNAGHKGNAKFLRGGDPSLVARWVKAENRPGFGIYYLPNPLKPGATVHGKENIAAIEFIYCDVDFKDVTETADEATQRLSGLLLRPTTMVDSGHGRHVLWQLKEAIACDDPEFERACALQAALVEYLGADPQVRPWSLLRLPGTLNSKQDPHVPCEVATSGPVVDISELREMAELVEGMTLLTRKPKATNGHDRAEGGPRMADDTERGPVDVEAELAAMMGGKSVNATHKRIVPSLLRKGEHPDDVLKFVVDETMARVGKRLAWSREIEMRVVISRILSAYNNLLIRDHDPATGVIPPWLPGEFHQRWLAALADGGRPSFRYNRHGFYLRTNGAKGAAADGGDALIKDIGPPAPGTVAGAGKERSGDKKDAGKDKNPWPTPYSGRAASQIPLRSFAMGQHYLIGATSITASGGGIGKSTLSLLDGVSFVIGRNLLTGETLEKRRRVWIWNAEDDVDEMERRLAGICAHYGVNRGDLHGWLFLDSGYDLPLDLAHGNSKGAIIQESTIDLIAARVKELGIEIVALDPLVALHTMAEGDNPGHAKLIRTLSTRLAKPSSCAVDINAHTRKPGVGQDAMTVDDIRGAGAIVYSARSGRILHPMSLAEAQKYDIEADDRFSYYRLERAKANMAKRGTICWVRVIEVPIANRPDGAYGDTVAVPAIWMPPDPMDGITETIAAAIASEIAKGEYKRDARAGTSWAGRLVGLRCGIDTGTKAGKERAKAILEVLIKKGVLAVDIRYDSNRNSREYIVPGVFHAR